MIAVILSVAAILVMVILVLVGMDENVLQFIGNVGQNLPIVGPWLNIISGFSKQTLDGSFQGSVMTALRTVLMCLSSNILDAAFLGLLDALVNHLLLGWRRDLTRIWDIGETVVVSLVGVILLYYMKKTGDTGYAILAGIGDIGLLLLGIGIMLSGRFPMLNLGTFLISGIAGVFEAASGIGLICSLLLIPSMLNNDISAMGMIVWVLCLAGLIVAARLVNYARRTMFER